MNGDSLFSTWADDSPIIIITQAIKKIYFIFIAIVLKKGLKGLYYLYVEKIILFYSEKEKFRKN